MRKRPTLIMMLGAACTAGAVLAVLMRLASRRKPAGAESVCGPSRPPLEERDPAADAPTMPAENSASTESAVVDGRSLPDVLFDPEIRVDTARRCLAILSAGDEVKRYAIALGTDPLHAKEREGDGRTPRGTFYVCTRVADSAYARALGISYPTPEDAQRGVSAGMVSTREERSIVAAHRHMERPPWKTALGGEIMIHGGGARRGDWTQGCIALDDADIVELFNAIPLGTTVSIL